MNKYKKTVLFAGLGIIALAVIIITSVSLIQYAVYRSQFKDSEAQVQIVTELSE